jgi:Zn-dependent protease with chaperone function
VTEPWNGKHAQRSLRERADELDERQRRHSAEDIPFDMCSGWLRRGLRRQRRGILIALLASWTGVWLAPWGALFGGLVGMLAAGGFATGWAASHHLYELGAGQAVSVVSLGSGLVLGAIAGLLLTILPTTLGNPVAGAVSVALGGLLTLVVVVLVATLERPMLQLRGYRRLSRDEVRRVVLLAQHVASAMDLDGLPRFMMSDTILPNAWTHMRTIVLTAGLLQMLDDAELAAVLAHELHHWRQGDAIGLRLLWAAALPIALVLNLGTWLAGAGATQRSPSPDRGADVAPRSARGVLAVFGWAIAWAAWVLTRLVIAPIAAASQRRYEYEADAGAASVGYSSALSSALSKIGAFEAGRTGWERTVMATHPPTALRLEALSCGHECEIEEEELVRLPFSGLLRVIRSAL